MEGGGMCVCVCVPGGGEGCVGGGEAELTEKAAN